MPRAKSYPHLEAYLTARFYIKSDDSKPVVLPTDEESAIPVILKMSCDMSPENLHCDGEISNAQANQRFNEIMRAKGDLELILGRKIELEY